MLRLRPGYPESLLIYHAGVGRTVFIGCLRITTIILFVASCGVLVCAFPSYWFSYSAVNSLLLHLDCEAYGKARLSGPFPVGDCLDEGDADLGLQAPRYYYDPQEPNWTVIAGTYFVPGVLLLS